MKSHEISRRAALAAGVGASVGLAGMARQPVVAVAFHHGVASGDPLADRVVIWTRVTPADPTVGAAPLRWAVAEDPDLRTVVAEGEIVAEALRDFTAKVDVDGLAPGRVYYYGFFAGDAASPVGRTRTLPVGAAERLSIAVFSCANYPFGRFHAYADAAARSDVDLAVHLGDYIYEYGGPTGWGWAEGAANDRVHEPQREVVSLGDYRTRYAQYRSDPDLQAAHAALPWIVTWDDHEITNNPWVDGAQNHNEDRGEGGWAQRKAAALEAFYEWMPIREPVAGRAREAIWRRFDWGDLASLVMLETRLTGRSEQLNTAADLKWLETAWAADAEGVMRIAPEDRLAATPGVERLRTPFDPSGAPVLDYERAKRMNVDGLPPGFTFRRDVDAFLDKLNDPSRTMIAPDQETWLLESVAVAEGRGAWSIVGGQIVFARGTLFDFARYYDEATLSRLEANSYIANQMELGRLGLPGNMDAWDGYPVQRDRIADALSAADAHVVMLAGDTHAFWANEVRDTAGARCAAEFGAAGVSSPGFGQDYGEVSPPIEDVFADGYPETRFVDAHRQGYLLVTFTPEEAVCDVIGTAPPAMPGPGARILKRLVQKRRGPDGVLPALEERDA